MMKSVILLLACALIVCNRPAACAENVTAAVATTSNNRTIEEKIDAPPAKEDAGFMSKLSNLLFGAAEDSETADTRQSLQYGAPPPSQYGPPTSGGQQQQPPQQECNPCNKEPWIPIMGNYGHHPMFGYLPPHQEVNNHQQQPHGGLYNQQNIPPSGSYGAPVHHNGFIQPPPPQPADSYGAPDIQVPVLPPEPQHQPPPKDYGPPQQSLDYGFPNKPVDNFGPPLKPIGPPAPLDFGFGPPKPQPPPDFAPLPSFPPPNNFNEPPPPTNFGNHYGPPKPIFKIPPKNYGPPINQPNFGFPPKPFYSLGKAPRQIRPGFGRPPPIPPHMHFGPPPPQPVYKYIPLHKGRFSNLPTNFKPPPPPPNYNPGGPIYNNFGGAIFNHPPPLRNHHDIKSQITNPEYLPPAEQLPIASDHNADPIPFPNLSSAPVAPLHNPQNFHDNFPQPGSHVEVPFESNVQIQQSIPVADFLASIEHPINVIRSPIVDVNVANTSSFSDGYFSTLAPSLLLPSRGHALDEYKPTYRPSFDDFKLSENPIVVEDTHVAAATHENKTVGNFDNLPSSEIGDDFINQILRGIGGYSTPAPLPAYSVLSTSMQPPPIGESPWFGPSKLNLSPALHPGLSNGFSHGVHLGPTYNQDLQPGRYVDGTKKPKQIQIIIPYTTNNEHDLKKTPPKSFSHDVYKGSESKEVTSVTRQPPTTVVNIQELFKHGNHKNHNFKNLPFDVVRLQKNIDGWTEQEYSKNFLDYANTPSATTTSKFIASKRIPDEYLTTLPYNVYEEPKVTTTSTTTTTAIPAPQFVHYHDHEPAGSNSKEYLESNLIATTEPAPTTPKYHKLSKVQSWDKIHIAVSPLTKEKIYVVTPQPKAASSNWRQSRGGGDNPADRNNSTFSISIVPMRNSNKTEDSNDVRVVLSEWPHLINNLATPNAHASASTERAPTSRHPLFGLMELSSYAPPGNSTIETYSGHSKVINAATASLRKRNVDIEAGEKKVTPTSTMRSAQSSMPPHAANNAQ